MAVQDEVVEDAIAQGRAVLRHLRTPPLVHGRDLDRHHTADLHTAGHLTVDHRHTVRGKFAGIE